MRSGSASPRLHSGALAALGTWAVTVWSPTAAAGTDARQLTAGIGLSLSFGEQQVQVGGEIFLHSRVLFTGGIDREAWWDNYSGGRRPEALAMAGLQLRVGLESPGRTSFSALLTGGAPRGYNLGTQGPWSSRFSLSRALEAHLGIELARLRKPAVRLGLAGVMTPSPSPFDEQGGPEAALRASLLLAHRSPPWARLGLDIAPLLRPLTHVDGYAGRPLRLGGRTWLPSLLTVSPLPPDAHALADQVRSELASVGTFRRLAAELDRLGAPTSLVHRARRAAEEEAGHALRCAGILARDHGPIILGPCPARPRRFSSRQVALATQLREALLDGHHGEGAAAAWGHRQAHSGQDEALAEAQHIIATEEEGHAALGRDIAAWCVGESKHGRSRSEIALEGRDLRRGRVSSQITGSP